MTAGFRERLVFDPGRGEYRDGGIRYMMIRPDALMGLFAELPEAARLPAMEALGRSIRTHGGKSAAAYRAMGAEDGARMLAVIAATAPELGWGVWRFTREPGGLVLEVENSPFVAGAGRSEGPVCHAIVGMLGAVGPMVLGGGVGVVEERCAAVEGGGACRFRVVANGALPGGGKG